MVDSETPLPTRMLRLVLLIVGAFAVLSVVVHAMTQKAVDGALLAGAAAGGHPRLYELLTVQTWLQAAVLGGLMALIGYFVILPVARKAEESRAEVERKAQELEFARQHDAVTGLMARQAFRRLLDHSCAVGERHGHAVGLLRLQLSGFRGSNGRIDFEAADALLVEVAERIGATVRAADCVARLGDDEFAVLVPRIKTVEGLGRLADRLIEDLGEAAGPTEETLVVGCAIGIAVDWPSESDGAAELLRRAAQALDEAQRESGSAWRYHASALQGLSDRLSIAG